jgi:hypothetical protein
MLAGLLAWVAERVLRGRMRRRRETMALQILKQLKSEACGCKMFDER